jgi:hypothetical protein
MLPAAVYLSVSNGPPKLIMTLDSTGTAVSEEGGVTYIYISVNSVQRLSKDSLVQLYSGTNKYIMVLADGVDLLKCYSGKLMNFRVDPIVGYVMFALCLHPVDIST